MKYKRCLGIISIVFFAIFFFTGRSVYNSKHLLQGKKHLLDDESAEAFTLIFLSDLHDHVFGSANSELITEIDAISPDLILLGGDMLNSYSLNSDIVCELVERLSDICPVYYGLGNHELEYMGMKPELVDELEAAGAIVLERDYIDTEVNGMPVRVGGLYDYAFNLAGVDDKKLEPDRVEVKRFLEEFEDTDAFKIIISHRPDSFVFGDAAEEWDIDLVVSGHLHGGQVVVPLLGGVYGGDQGYFPEYVHGMYEKGNMHLFVTSGLGTNKKAVPRVNNRPEVAVISVGE